MMPYHHSHPAVPSPAPSASRHDAPPPVASSSSSSSSTTHLGKRRRPSAPPSPPPTGGELYPPGPSSPPRLFPSPAPFSRYSSPPAHSTPRRVSAANSEDDGTPTVGGRGEWTYTLEVIQQPVRARACGFGDKDRRPLSPPPIIRLWIRKANGDLVDPKLVNNHFLILTVDLWAADRRSQRNVVMHPATGNSRDDTSSYGPSHDSQYTESGSSSRPLTATARPDSGWSQKGWGEHSGRPTSSSSYPSIASPLSNQHPMGHMPESYFPHHPAHHSPVPPWAPPTPPQPPTPIRRSSYNNQAGPHHPPPPSFGEPSRPLTAPSTSRSSFHPLTLPSLDSLQGRYDAWTMPSPGTLGDMRYRSQPSEPSSAPSTSAGSRPPTDYSFGRPSTSNTTSTWFSGEGQKDAGWWGEVRPNTGGSGWGRPSTTESGNSVRWADVHAPPPPPRPSSGYGQYHQPYPPEHGFQPSLAPYRDVSPQTHSGDVGSFSRVLVGSLCSVCQRLQDADGNLGLFFFAHDLGVRTEGEFVLKFSVADLSSMMMGVPPRGQKTSVLAETWSQPFTVYSAKKFPGVIPTTDLTRLFANQNVRLPTRQRRAMDTAEQPASTPARVSSTTASRGAAARAQAEGEEEGDAEEAEDSGEDEDD